MRAIRYKDETLGAEYVVDEIPADQLEEAKHYRENLIEKVSEADDKLLEKYVGGEEITEADIKSALRKRAIRSVRHEKAPFVPVICGSAFKNKGVQPLLDAVVDYLPSPLDIPPVIGIDPRKADETQVEREASDNAPFSALAFKIMTDPFVGQLAFIRVYSGVMNVRARWSTTRPRARPSASAASSRCTRTSARRSRRSTPATSPPPSASGA